MDQRARDVEADLKEILQTRQALGEKISLLEKRVDETVQGTKAAALAALDFARNKAADFIETAAENLDPNVQARRRPWVMVGGAVAIGLLAGLLEQRRRNSGYYRYYPPKAAGAEVMPSKGRDEAEVPSGVYPFYTTGQEQHDTQRDSGWSERPHKRSERSTPATGWMADLWRPLFSLWGELAGELTQERDRLQQAALHAGRSFVRDAARIIGQSLLDQLSRPHSISQSQRLGQSSTYR
jgi:ElaB/YqjD/DUF883 family membrane-anchored ribosome-binding protein